MSIKTFIDAYLECAIWSSTDGDVPLDANYSVTDIAVPTLQVMESECNDFYDANHETWEAVDMDDAQAGHDFWLTRNGHGTGFWDRGIGAAGDELTRASKPYGSFDLYIGDDGEVHGS